MSAFVCILDRSGANVDPREIDRLAEPLESHGGTLSSVCRGPVAMAIRHAGGVSSRERYGPLTDPATGLMVAVTGQFSVAGDAPAQEQSEHRPAAPACASMALDALPRLGASFLAGLSGSFVVIAADPRQHWLSVARDHLGDLKVYYHLDRRWLIAASEPAAILRHCAVADDLD